MPCFGGALRDVLAGALTTVRLAVPALPAATGPVNVGIVELRENHLQRSIDQVRNGDEGRAGQRPDHQTVGTNA